MYYPLDEPGTALIARLKVHLTHDPASRAVLEQVSMQADSVFDGDTTTPRGLRAAWLLAELDADGVSLISAVLADSRLDVPDAVMQTLLAGLDAHDYADVLTLQARIEKARDVLARYQAPVSMEQNRLWQRLLLAVCRDIRAVLVLLAFAVEQMRGLAGQDDPAIREQTASCALRVFAPLAHQLGLGQLKWELEDLAFRHLEPVLYADIARKLDDRRANRERYLQQLRGHLTQVLREAGVTAKVYGRPKHIYSIWGKMQKKRLSFEQLFDVRALRIEVDSIEDCYAALSLVHEQFAPIESEYDDYIARPKPNGYQSLHTAVRAFAGKVVEIQIRTQKMHAFAEFGVAAHWRYKSGQQGAHPMQEALESIRQQWEQSDGSAENLPELAAAVDVAHVYVFTPDNALVELPAEATVLDFAYKIHTQVGHRCRGGLINGDIAPLKSRLSQGDQVRVLTQSNAEPSRLWGQAHSGFLHSASARAKVRNYFYHQDRKARRERGRLLTERVFRHLKVDAQRRSALLKQLGFADEDRLFEAVGGGSLALEAITVAARRQNEPETPPRKHTQTTATDTELASDEDIYGAQARLCIESHQIDGLKITVARCCSPKPGQPVMAFLSQSQGYKLHRPDCANLRHLIRQHPDRVLSVDWPDADDAQE